jgi:hypothetical protein
MSTQLPDEASELIRQHQGSELEAAQGTHELTFSYWAEAHTQVRRWSCPMHVFNGLRGLFHAFNSSVRINVMAGCICWSPSNYSSRP